MDTEKRITRDTVVRISAYSISDETEFRLKKALGSYLELFGCSSLFSPLYICTKELLINAIKANYKYIFFEGYPENGEDEQGQLP